MLKFRDFGGGRLFSSSHICTTLTNDMEYSIKCLRVRCGGRKCVCYCWPPCAFRMAVKWSGSTLHFSSCRSFCWLCGQLLHFIQPGPTQWQTGQGCTFPEENGLPGSYWCWVYFCVGIIMLPATALLFRKLGIFLLLVKCVACGFATFFFQSLCCFFGPQKNCGRITLPCVTKQATENILSSCSATEPGTTNPAANGAFGCGTGSRVRRSFNKESEGFLCPNQQHHRKRQPVSGREPEQYELQPLACQLSDSFENSTCTSKLSNRPSVLSDDIQFCGLSPRQDYDQVSIEADSAEIHLKSCNPPPALQTSSPYKENMLRPVVTSSQDASKEKVLCKKCQGQSSSEIQLWNVSLSSSSSMEEITITQTTDTVNERSLSIDEATSCHLHKRLLSCQSQSSMEGLEDSNETCLSEVEPAILLPQAVKIEEELQPGHLNGKRDTLRLSLKETVYDLASPGSGRLRTTQSDVPVILPNSKPDMPNVWIKREGKGEGGSWSILSTHWANLINHSMASTLYGGLNFCMLIVWNYTQCI